MAGDQDEKLIHLVKSYPHLYDVTLKSNKDSFLKTSSWIEAGKVLNIAAEDCVKRWQNLRKRYIKERRINKGGDGYGGQWSLFPQMDFFDIYIKPSKNESIYKPLTENSATAEITDTSSTTVYNFGSHEFNISDDENAFGDLVTDNIVSCNKPDNKSTSQSSLVASKPNLTISTPNSNLLLGSTFENNKRKKLDDIEEDILKLGEESTELHHPAIATDGIGHYALSVAETMRRLPIKKQQMAKIKIDQLLFHMEFDDM